MLKASGILFKTFFDICRLRLEPQKLPNSYELLVICIVVYTAINFLLATYTAPILDAFLASGIETVLVSIITVVILRFNRHPERLLKTLMALTGTGAVLSLFALPLFAVSINEALPELIQALILFLYLALIVWNVTIMAHIMRHALNTTFGIGVLFALTYIFITSILIALLVPDLKT